MSEYKRILAAVDFAPSTDHLCGRAAQLSRLAQAELAFIHVVEPLLVEPAYDVLPAVPVELEADMEARARKELLKIGDRYGVAPDRCWTVIGSTKTGIIDKAEEWSADLIVIGSHGRHGVAWLLGSTANAVLHGAPCDVLAVRIPADRE